MNAEKSSSVPVHVDRLGVGSYFEVLERQLILRIDDQENQNLFFVLFYWTHHKEKRGKKYTENLSSNLDVN